MAVVFISCTGSAVLRRSSERGLPAALDGPLGPMKMCLHAEQGCALRASSGCPFCHCLLSDRERS